MLLHEMTTVRLSHLEYLSAGAWNDNISRLGNPSTRRYGMMIDTRSIDRRTGLEEKFCGYSILHILLTIQNPRSNSFILFLLILPLPFSLSPNLANPLSQLRRYLRIEALWVSVQPRTCSSKGACTVNRCLVFCYNSISGFQILFL
uniref:Uncharacterized protein n=1 Tax=Rhizophora mucronata TaxID=61149 RepID=A0A2P2PRE5_RHIMU